jgi:hypothetical protein
MKPATTGTIGPELPPDDSHGDLAAETDFLPEFCHFLFPQCAGEVGPATIDHYLRDNALFQRCYEMDTLLIKFVKQ